MGFYTHNVENSSKLSIFLSLRNIPTSKHFPSSYLFLGLHLSLHTSSLRSYSLLLTHDLDTFMSKETTQNFYGVERNSFLPQQLLMHIY